MYIAVLACAAGLLLVFSLYIGLAFNCFSVSDLLIGEFYGYAEFFFQLRSDDADL